MKVIEIRGPSGVGDAFYMNPIVKEFTLEYDTVIVRTKHHKIAV